MSAPSPHVREAGAFISPFVEADGNVTVVTRGFPDTVVTHGLLDTVMTHEVRQDRRGPQPWRRRSCSLTVRHS